MFLGRGQGGIRVFVRDIVTLCRATFAMLAASDPIYLNGNTTRQLPIHSLRPLCLGKITGLTGKILLLAFGGCDTCDPKSAEKIYLITTFGDEKVKHHEQVCHVPR